MAARGSKAGPNTRGQGDNSQNSDDEIIRRAAAAHKEMQLKRAAFNAKMKERHEKEVSAPLKGIGIKMKHASRVLDNYMIETGIGDDAVAKATADRVLALDTERRMFAALHDGEQLDFLKVAEQADKVRREAEAEVGTATEEVDGGEDAG